MRGKRLLKLFRSSKVHERERAVGRVQAKGGDGVAPHAKGLEEGVDQEHLLLAVVVHVKGRVVGGVVDLVVDGHGEPVAGAAGADGLLGGGRVGEEGGGGGEAGGC